MSSLGLHVYRLVAKIMGAALCRHEIVECVYANHGVGRGEISFARSDIDLTVVVRRPDSESGDGAGLYSLLQKFRALRRINPAMSHLLVNDANGLDRWMRVDTYNGSQERRSLLLLAGKAIQLPNIPVLREDAVRRIPFIADRFFSIAVQQNNRRLVHKMAVEVWKAWGVAQKLAPEPYLTLREAVQQAHGHPIGSSLASVHSDRQRATEFIMRLAGILHDELLPPLKKLREAFVFPIRMLPRSASRTLVVLPQPGAALPAAAYKEQSLLATPEMLHLYLHYLNPFLAWTLPQELRSLGFKTPGHHAFLRACLFHGQDSMWRRPGFTYKDAAAPCIAFAFNQYSIPYLQDGQVPPPMPEEKVKAVLAHNPSCFEFYQRDFAGFYRESMGQMKVLQQLEAAGTRSHD
jgi:hypothetical protein